jgi:SET domain-containing protein
MIKVPTKIEIKESPGKGLGVFATEDIEKEEVIEECLLLKLPIEKGEMSSLFLDYRFNYPQSGEWTEQVLPMGYGVYYNHSSTNNAYWRDHPSIRAFQFVANRKIEKGEEICTFYGDDGYWNDGRESINILD